MIFSRRAIKVCFAGTMGVVFFVAVLVACTSEPTQPPTPISPIPTPTPLEDTPVSIQPAVVTGETYIYWGDPAIPITGHATFRCPDDYPQCAEQWQLRIDLELWQDGMLLMTQTVETDIHAVYEISHGLFHSVGWEWPAFDGEAEGLMRLVWYSNVYTDVIYIGWHVDENNQVTERDERGFSSVGTVQGSYSVYMPLIFFRPK